MHESNLLWNFPMKLEGLPSPNLKTCFSFTLRCPVSFEVDVEIGLLINRQKWEGEIFQYIP